MNWRIMNGLQFIWDAGTYRLVIYAASCYDSILFFHDVFLPLFLFFLFIVSLFSDACTLIPFRNIYIYRMNIETLSKLGFTFASLC